MISVGVFFGSQSVEHEVSIITAVQTMMKLETLQDYNVVPIYIDKKGTWYTGEGLKSINLYKDLPALLSNCKRVNLVRQGRTAVLIPNPVNYRQFKAIHRIDIAFPIIHGTFGEDGTIQGLFEMLDLPYVGCDVLSAALTMDKIACKDALKNYGIPVVEGFGFSSEDWFFKRDDIYKNIETLLRYPVIVKPSNMGSSIGVSVVKSAQELKKAVDLCLSFTERILVERFVSNLMEINISVLGDCEQVQLSACERPLSSNEILSYEDKYQRKGTKKTGFNSGSKGAGMASLDRVLPADIAPTLQEKIEFLAKKAFLSLNASGVARLDFIVDKDTKGVFLNELNTIPGSLAFYLWEASGLSFEDLLSSLLKLALQKYRRRKNLLFSTESNLLKTMSLSSTKTSS